MIKAVLFDLDNTLFDTHSVVRKTRWEACGAMIDAGLPAASTKEAFTRLNKIIKRHGSNFNRHFNKLCEEYKIESDPKIIAAGIAAYHNAKAGLLRLYPGVDSMLVKLIRQRYRLGMVTNGLAIKQWDKIHRLGLQDFFDAIVVSDNRDPQVSKVTSIKKAIKKLGVKPEEAVFVGDYVKTDIDSANRLGMVSVQVMHRAFKPPAKPTRYQKPDHKIKSTADIVDVLARLKKES